MSYTNEKRFKKIFISDGDTILPTVNIFYGPYDSLSTAVNYINEFCDELGVDVPLGITVAIYTDNTKNSIKEYRNNSIEGSFCKVSDFDEIVTKENIDNGNFWYEPNKD